MFRLEPALFSGFNVVELVVCDRVIKIGPGAIQGIEIRDVVTSDVDVIQRIAIQDVISKSKQHGPIFFLIGHGRERHIRWQEPGIDRCGLGIRAASLILQVFLL